MKLNIIDIPEIINDNIIYNLLYPHDNNIQRFLEFWELAIHEDFRVFLWHEHILYMHLNKNFKIRVSNIDYPYILLSDTIDISNKKFFSICNELFNIMNEEEVLIPNIFRNNLPLSKLGSSNFYVYKDSILDKMSKKLITNPKDIITTDSVIYGFTEIDYTYSRPIIIRPHFIIGVDILDFTIGSMLDIRIAS